MWRKVNAWDGWKSACVVESIDEALVGMKEAGYVPSVEEGGIRLRFTDGADVKTNVHNGRRWKVEDAVIREGDVVLRHDDGYVCVVRGRK